MNIKRRERKKEKGIKNNRVKNKRTVQEKNDEKRYDTNVGERKKKRW